MEALQLHNGEWVVRPRGQLGTCGWYPYPWEIILVEATDAADALRKAEPEVLKQHSARRT